MAGKLVPQKFQEKTVDLPVLWVTTWALPADNPQFVISVILLKMLERTTVLQLAGPVVWHNSYSEVPDCAIRTRAPMLFLLHVVSVVM